MSYKIIAKDKLNGINRFKLLNKSAKKRNIEVTLKYEYYRKLISGGCFYCGESLNFQKGYSVDRFDNKEGYTEENSLGCCWDCNRSKGNKTQNEFYRWMNKLIANQRKLFEIEKTNTKYIKNAKDLMSLVNKDIH